MTFFATRPEREAPARGWQKHDSPHAKGLPACMNRKKVGEQNCNDAAAVRLLGRRLWSIRAATKGGRCVRGGLHASRLARHRLGGNRGMRPAVPLSTAGSSTWHGQRALGQDSEERWTRESRARGHPTPNQIEDRELNSAVCELGRRARIEIWMGQSSSAEFDPPDAGPRASLPRR